MVEVGREAEGALWEGEEKEAVSWDGPVGVV